ncbi:MAG: D-alanine--D-alanine ligase [Alphaproteobacteria bacterium]|nr:D-alanine--D-alanine ligase [Alphaproteobacteria bacterium]
MKIGMTYDLRSEYLAMGMGEEETAEFDRGETIDQLEAALRTLGHTPVRIGNVRALVAALAAGERWDAVLNICEGVRGYGREAQVPALLEAYGIPCTFADPLTASLTLHKGMAKRVLRDAGVPTTPFVLVSRLEDIEAVDLPFPLFCKPVAEGTAKGIHPTSRVLDRDALREVCGRLLAQYRQLVLVEPFLPGREFTTAIVGEGDTAEVVGTMEVILLPGLAEQHAYTYLNKEESEERCDFPLATGTDAEDCARVALAAWRALGCRDAGRVDLRADASGTLMVMEANPLPGMHEFHSDLPMICARVGVTYVDLVGRIVDAALARRGA